MPKTRFMSDFDRVSTRLFTVCTFSFGSFGPREFCGYVRSELNLLRPMRSPARSVWYSCMFLNSSFLQRKEDFGQYCTKVSRLSL
jgi:hypothetical protein